MAASIKEVLASSSPLEAEGFLNDLGFPPVAVTVGQVPAQAAVEQIGNNSGGSASGAQTGSVVDGTGLGSGGRSRVRWSVVPAARLRDLP